MSLWTDLPPSGHQWFPAVGMDEWRCTVCNEWLSGTARIKFPSSHSFSSNNTEHIDYIAGRTLTAANYFCPGVVQPWTPRPIERRSSEERRRATIDRRMTIRRIGTNLSRWSQ